MIARHQHEHEAINAREYPGTRKICALCNEPTGRCEDDSLYTEIEDGDLGPVCESCYELSLENVIAHPRQVWKPQKASGTLIAVGCRGLFGF